MHKSSSSSSLGPGGLDLSKTFFTPISGGAPPSATKRPTKITVVGVGNVGMAIAQTILTQDLADELALIDAKEDKLRGEMLDLQHAAAFLPRTKIHASLDYAITANSDLCIVTAGARQNPGESRLNLLQRNVALFRHIVPPLAKYSPDCIIMVVSNPVDVLTYVAWKLSGFPANRVIGSGTNLDSSRFRFLIADHLDVNAQDVQAYIVGEHGDSSVALWSSISVGGVPVLSFLKRQQIAYEKETLENIHKEVVQSAYEVIRLKGYTSWAIGYSVASLARTLLRDQRRIHPVSVLAKGFYDIEGGEVFLSLPAQLGRNGVLGVANVHLNDEEAQQLRNSAKTILEKFVPPTWYFFVLINQSYFVFSALEERDYFDLSSPDLSYPAYINDLHVFFLPTTFNSNSFIPPIIVLNANFLPLRVLKETPVITVDRVEKYEKMRKNFEPMLTEFKETCAKMTDQEK
ncbi:L-lactate dehydrogenase A [Sesamum alatum]|uniref:L-lactate dehydrogenase n=1 Tax=Sesamum alatum TaxID=300844 RepID=A0AAE1YRX7_9LAMI|nr:L-lactate dehydrogenase A [Sesamum alatum]